MKNNKIGNIVLMLSLAFFLMASVAAFVPDVVLESENVDIKSVELNITMSSCDTCDFGSGGPSGTCQPANFCGMRNCTDGSPCNMSGGVCGPDCENGGCQGTELCEN
jgi:hypothetical protein